jgi:transposase
MRVEVLGGLERRRRWSQDDKARIVKETLIPSAKMTDVARRNGVAASVVLNWRRLARTVEKVGPCFAPVQIAAAVARSAEEVKPKSSRGAGVSSITSAMIRASTAKTTFFGSTVRAPTGRHCTISFRPMPASEFCSDHGLQKGLKLSQGA